MAMEMGNLSFFGEKEDVDHQRSRVFLRPFIPEIISGNSMNILSTLQEKEFEEHDRTLYFPLVADDDVDTTLTLFTAVSRNSASPSPVHSPMPLRSCPPANKSSLTSLNLGSNRSNKRKREGNGGKKREKRSSNGGNKRGKRSSNVDGEDPRPVTPRIEEFPALAQALEEKGVRPVFLYRKKLEGSDVKPGLNRLFVTKREPLFNFLSAAEAEAVDGGGRGIDAEGVDERGKPYKLGVRKWLSLNATVIVSEWSKLAAANAAQKGDSVEIWGFRSDGKLGLAITFRR